MRALSIAWKDLRHTYRRVAGVAMMLAAPLLLAFILGAAFGTGDSFSIGATKAVVVDLDVAAVPGMPAAGATVVSALTSPELSDLLEVTREDSAEAARAMVDDGRAGLAVIVPADLSAALMGSAAAGPTAGGGAQEPVAIEIYQDPTLTIGPAIARAVVHSVAQSLEGARAAAAAAAQLGAQAGITDYDRLAGLATTTAETFAVKTQESGPATLSERPPEIAGAGEQREPNVASQVLVGMMLFFMLFGASVPARSILDEHRAGTLSRLFTTPTPRTVVLLGKYLSVFLVVLVQVAVLLIVGRLLFGARWGEPGPVIVLTLVSALLAASLGLLAVSFAKTPAQAGAASSAIFVFLGLISGNFTGGVDVGGAYAVVQKVSPLGWLMQSWGDLLYGGSWSSIGIPVVVVLAFTLVFFGLATLFFRRRYV